VREDHGVPEQQMTGLMERLQAFRVPDDGREGGATLAYSEMLRAGTTTATDVTVPFDGWLETMARSGMRFYAAPTFASARWGMSAPQTVTWKWDEARGLAEFEKAQRVMADAEAHNSNRLDTMVSRRRSTRSRPSCSPPAAGMPTSRAGGSRRTSASRWSRCAR
jgi:cytosine/adenosine deaminase-related metal-dependent hydrolase